MTMFGWLGSDEAPEAAPQVGAASGMGQVGLAGSVRVAGPGGWRAVRSVAPGDMLLTFDGGLQRVEATMSEPASPACSVCPNALWPIEVPPGALGNRDLMHLAADQPILIESDLAETLTGDPFALVPARSLTGVRGIHRAPPSANEVVVTLSFADEQIVFAPGGAALHCPVAADLLAATGAPARYPLLPLETALRVVSQLAPATLQARSAGLPGIRS
ncbi:Hint domain-containing protein [Roseovarius nanhaiticus]|uniref:Hint domain-containing protein n=1 Tax=Roseovarius nanhaiticus TaxID=573024 RepID=UPI0024936EB1|nr:Hint domain-containing protein [Roseovarius nanhaiticus]